MRVQHECVIYGHMSMENVQEGAVVLGAVARFLQNFN